MQSKTKLEADAAATQRRMDSANVLLSALAGEEGRWTQQSSAFDNTIQRLTGNEQYHLFPQAQFLNSLELNLPQKMTPKTSTAPLQMHKFPDTNNWQSLLNSLCVSIMEEGQNLLNKKNN